MSLDFSLTRYFVVPSDNTIPAAGTTATLAHNELGVFLPNNTPATATTAGTAKYVYVARGQRENPLNKKALRSGYINTDLLINAYVVKGTETVTQQEATITLSASTCGEQVALHIRTRSFYTGFTQGSPLGLERTFVAATPCCGCDGDPCEELTAEELEAIVEDLFDRAVADKQLAEVLEFERAGAVITIKGKPQEYVDSTNVFNQNYVYSAVTFEAFIYEGAATTQDMVVDGCEQIGAYEKTQDIKFPFGLPSQIRDVEVRYQSYDRPNFKYLSSANPDGNRAFTSLVEDGIVYDEIHLQLRDGLTPINWSATVTEDIRIVIAVPNTLTAAWLTILEGAVGTIPEI